MVSAIGLMQRIGLRKAPGMEAGLGIRNDKICRTSVSGVYEMD